MDSPLGALLWNGPATLHHVRAQYISALGGCVARATRECRRAGPKQSSRRVAHLRQRLLRFHVPLLLLAIIPLMLLAAVVLMPLTLVQRYRVGTSRRLARGWLATLNAAGFVASAALLLTSAAFANIWMPHAFLYALAGLGIGCLLGALGLALSRWEVTPASLHYTPNRWLVLAITLVVTSRLVYGVWRSWHAWHVRADDTSWIAASGAAGSLAAGAVVLGYYVAYWIGLRRRFERHRRAIAPASRSRRRPARSR
jgi:hypothetical protein